MDDSKEKDHVDLPMAEMPRSGVRAYTTWPDMIKHWPKTTLCIVANEFCERFSYYGMKTVLTLYILNILKFPSSTSTIFFNCFDIVCYLTPLLGSVIADGYIGKFWTIFSVSILYAIGQIVLAVASIQPSQSSLHPYLDLLGLVMIGLGTGGIKPCVSAFGADQFEMGQDRMLSIYFSMFYFSINAGSMISSFISPIFRSMPCLNQDSCYPLTFGIPAILMIVATGIFMAGSFWYKKPPPTENVFAEVGRIIGGAVGNKFSRHNTGPREHWLEHYLDTHDCSVDAKCIARQGTKKKNKCQKKSYVADIRGLLNIIVMVIPVPFFWTLYNQQPTFWLIQGIQMDCSLGSVLLLPDQMQTLNAVLILIFIPVFQVIVYPLFGKCFNLTPLRKMMVGGLLCALAFIITGFVQLQVNTTLPQLPENGETYVSFMNVWDNNTNCNITVTPQLSGTSSYSLPADSSMVDIREKSSTFHIKSGEKTTFNIAYSSACKASQGSTLQKTVTYTFEDKSVNYVAVGPLGIIKHVSDTAKPSEGTGEFSLGITVMTETTWEGNFAVCRLDASEFDPKNPCNPRSPPDFYFWETNYNDGLDDRAENITIVGRLDGKKALAYKYKSVKPGNWGMFYLNNKPKDYNYQTFSKEDTNVTATGVTFEIKGQGGVYAMILTGAGNVPAPVDHLLHNRHTYQVVQDNSVNILWQVPQIVVLTAAEILFSITGYEFMYSQSAPSMKALVQAIWLLTTAIGDAIIILITALNLFDNQATEFFAYGGAMFVVMIIFALLAIFYYEYQYYTHEEEEEEDSEEVSDGLDNESFVPEKQQIGNMWDINEEEEEENWKL